MNEKKRKKKKEDQTRLSIPEGCRSWQKHPRTQPESCRWRSQGAASGCSGRGWPAQWCTGPELLSTHCTGSRPATSHKWILISTVQGTKFVCWLLSVQATCECISGTDLLRQFYVLPHWDRSCRSNFPSHPVTVYWYRTNQSKHWPYNARRSAG